MGQREEEDDDMVMVEVRPGEAALLFTLEGLQAFLPDDIGEVSEGDLPWHLRVVERAMNLIRDYAVEQQLLHEAEHGKDCPTCQLDALLAIARHHAKHQTVGES